MENKPTKIIVEYDDKKIELTTYWDSDIDDWVNVFKTIMFWLSFTPESIKVMFGEEDN